MQTIRFLTFALMVTAFVASAQDISTPRWVQDKGSMAPTPVTLGELATAKTTVAGSAESFSLLSSGSEAFIAEAITPEIAALARGLENDPKGIYDYVHDHIRYEHYFGSKKGAQLTLLERGGNDFDQGALLVALLQSAGQTNVTYQFGTVIMPYETTNHQDFRHWVGTSKTNTIWDDPVNTNNGTIYFLSTLNYRGGFPFTGKISGDTNQFIFHHLWVQLSFGGTNYLLDPSFKVSEPIQGIDLSAAMGLSTNDLLSAAGTGATNTADYVQNLNEGSLRGKLRDYTTNLLAYLQNNYPNAAVEEILGGRRIVSSANLPLGATLPYQIYSSGTNSTSIQWASIPTDYMSWYWMYFDDVDQTTQFFYLPELQGRRLSLTFDTNGLAQLWLEDEELLQEASTGSSTIDVYQNVDHPHGFWSFYDNTIVGPWRHSDYDVPATYTRTNANYALLYAFAPGPEWLRQRQERLDAYRSQGLADTSREVQTETLNVMGLSWMVQTELAQRAVALQQDLIPINHHRIGRMGQVSGAGNFIDVYIQHDSTEPANGNLDADNQRAYQAFDVKAYFASAAESGVIEQMQSTGVAAASTVKMLQLAITNGQSIFLAKSNNWTSGANVRSQLVNYDLNFLDGLINTNYSLFLPQNGSNHVAGAGSWAGFGIVELLDTPAFRYCGFVISGGYNGGFGGQPSSLQPSLL